VFRLCATLEYALKSTQLLTFDLLRIDYVRFLRDITHIFSTLRFWMKMCCLPLLCPWSICGRCM